ncbi:Peptidase M20 domain-containing protein 2 [Pleurostoma richardsiae]|uniref:Peptidase M20 domain-containing protein 2 n=1 Tax=Pleurostoma richardsiae TaxID=41990 RepID=A0AA38VXM5_9PEZI|nr:Peptidase M20 domain-containing protein 2 [Pleurostoma richardsiae]
MTVVVQDSHLQPAEVIDEVVTAIDDANKELRRLNLGIFNHPELAFGEVEACKLLSDWFEARGWSVSRGVYGVETAFEARFSVKEGGRTVCFNAEYDALPGMGHACGHNLIATSSIASAIGVEAVMKARNLPGTLVVMGTPAEESCAGKWIMAKNGAWRGFDACVMSHGMANFSTPLCCTKASWKLKARFRGKTAHAATGPWTGRNACDAIVHAYNGIALLRQHLAKGESIQGVILEAGKVSNLIPDFSEGSFSVRAPDIKRANALRARVERIFEAAADSTGCKVELDWNALYEDVVSNGMLAEQYRQYMLKHLGMEPNKMLPLDEARIAHDQPGCSDFGSCSYICPGIQVMFEIKAADLPHSIGFLEAAEGEFAHGEALRAGKANALICLDVLMNDEFAAEMKAEFVKSMKEAGRWTE